MTDSQPSYRWRYILIIVLLLLATAGLIARVVDLNILNRHFLRGQGDARTLRVMAIPAYRGMITDRNGIPLAISTPVDSVWIDPHNLILEDENARLLAKELSLPLGVLHSRLNKNSKREFIYLKRNIDPATAANITALNIHGVHLQHSYRRFYPEGEVTAHILGFTNVDDQGQEGLELAYNDWLQGVPGQKRVLKDRLGNIVEELQTIREPRPGHDLMLSLDKRIQYLAYRELKNGVQQFHADSGSVVVLDVRTGEVLAVANIPTFNPNDRSQVHDGRYRNRAMTDLFEPGSTIKPFSMVSALASGKYSLHSLVNTAPGWMMVEGKRITDDEHNLGVIDLTTVLQRSSNVGMSKITLSLPPISLWNLLHALGFGQVTNSGFPGERPGIMVDRALKHPFALATMSFGYGISVSLIQLAQAYETLANAGMKLPITLIHSNEPPAGQQVIKPSVAKTVLAMLESVLQKGGTAPLAKVQGYRVTGKTGTAHIVGSNGYLKNRYNSIFVGIAPASAPRIVVAVFLHDPQGELYYGGYTAGPIFSKIMGGSLRILDIPPDAWPSNERIS